MYCMTLESVIRGDNRARGWSTVAYYRVARIHHASRQVTLDPRALVISVLDCTFGSEAAVAPLQQRPKEKIYTTVDEIYYFFKRMHEERATEWSDWGATSFWSLYTRKGDKFSLLTRSLFYPVRCFLRIAWFLRCTLCMIKYCSGCCRVNFLHGVIHMVYLFLCFHLNALYVQRHPAFLHHLSWPIFSHSVAHCGTYLSPLLICFGHYRSSMTCSSSMSFLLMISRVFSVIPFSNNVWGAGVNASIETIFWRVHCENFRSVGSIWTVPTRAPIGMWRQVAWDLEWDELDHDSWIFTWRVERGSSGKVLSRWLNAIDGVGVVGIGGD